MREWLGEDGLFDLLRCMNFISEWIFFKRSLGANLRLSSGRTEICPSCSDSLVLLSPPFSRLSPSAATLSTLIAGAWVWRSCVLGLRTYCISSSSSSLQQNLSQSQLQRRIRRASPTQLFISFCSTRKARIAFSLRIFSSSTRSLVFCFDFSEVRFRQDWILKFLSVDFSPEMRTPVKQVLESCDFFRAIWSSFEPMLENLRCLAVQLDMRRPRPVDSSMECFSLPGCWKWISCSECDDKSERMSWWQSVSSMCMACTLKSCTERSSMERFCVMTISLRGRKYLMTNLSSRKTTPHLLGLKEVRTQFLARWMASWMSCLWTSLKVDCVRQGKAESMEACTQWQKMVKVPPVSSAFLILITFLWYISLRALTFSSKIRRSFSVLNGQAFLTKILFLSSQLVLLPDYEPKGNQLFISIMIVLLARQFQFFCIPYNLLYKLSKHLCPDGGWGLGLGFDDLAGLASRQSSAMGS